MLMYAQSSEATHLTKILLPHFPCEGLGVYYRQSYGSADTICSQRRQQLIRMLLLIYAFDKYIITPHN